MALTANEDNQRFLANNAYLASLIDKLRVAPEETPEAVAGRRIGPYICNKVIGKGGMGQVFLAHRADGAFDQQVALKLLRRDLLSEHIEQRFLAERHILAQLQHEHIARLLDDGVTDEGRPYFVMEYIDGVPITDYCDANRLSVEQRLALFRQVCRAVQYAHTNLVVHRDLKPSNILVTEDAAGKPQVKLLDFGIAKLLSEEGATRCFAGSSP